MDQSQHEQLQPDYSPSWQDEMEPKVSRSDARNCLNLDDLWLILTLGSPSSHLFRRLSSCQNRQAPFQHSPAGWGITPFPGGEQHASSPLGVALLLFGKPVQRVESVPVILSGFWCEVVLITGVMKIKASIFLLEECACWKREVPMKCS